jgi:hypothetical protein
MGGPVTDHHTQIAAGLEQFVILTRDVRSAGALRSWL